MDNSGNDIHAVARAVATVLLDFRAHPETAGPCV